jgi:Arc/MetJ-type ribon-helix-helix transcriptional regulator
VTFIPEWQLFHIAQASDTAPGASARLTAGAAILTLKVMEVQFTPDQKAFIRQALESGRLRREEDALKEALSLWEERERTRAEILAAVEEAETSLARGEGRVITQESMSELAEEVKRRGRARLDAEAQTSR